MADQVTNYKCPACTGPMHFDSATGKLHCDYCDSSYEVAEIEALYAQKNSDAAASDQAAQKIEEDSTEGWDFSESGSDWGSDASGVRAFNCPSCGAELILDETIAATSCPYCNNPTIIPSSLAGSLKPDCIIPFKLNKEQAKEAFRNYLKGKKLLPKLFYEESHLDEIKGVYVPFWLFDAHAEADIRYKGKTVRHWSDRDFNYTETKIFNLERSGFLDFERVPVDGSKKMADELMESVEPFDTAQLENFKTAYLAGYYADRYDVAAKDAVPRANERMQKSVKNMFDSTTRGYIDVTPLSSHIRIAKGGARYALFPVWIMNTTWHDEKFVFAMNGQTGKFVGNLPCDNSLRWKWHGIYTGIFAAALVLIELLINLM